MPHTDGPAYFPYVCILSLNSGTVINFWENFEKVRTNEYLARVYLEPRSLLIFTDDLYNKNLHGINEGIEDVIYRKDTYDGTTLATTNLELTNLEVPEGSEYYSVPRDDFRLSLTIRYVAMEEPIKG
jgi:hypothetical protein